MNPNDLLNAIAPQVRAIATEQASLAYAKARKDMILFFILAAIAGGILGTIGGKYAR